MCILYSFKKFFVCHFDVGIQIYLVSENGSDNKYFSHGSCISIIFMETFEWTPT